MDNYPFFCKNFTSNWLKYFSNNPNAFSFGFIGPIKFVKSKFSLFYYNVGKNITNGTYYDLNVEEKDYKGKVFLIYDVLSYLSKEDKLKNPNLKIKQVVQYSGHLSRMDNFENFNEYFSAQFSAKSRNNLRKYQKRLDQNFSTKFNIFFGEISREDYEDIFEKMIGLIGKRFGQLGLDNNILNLKDYYYDLAYDMICNKEASLYVLYQEDEPIAISLCFLSQSHLFFAITTFDTDFRRYNLGHVLIMNIMDWCYNNNISVFDYSKGTYDYKLRWANESYNFENHILYDSKSLKAIITGNYLYAYFRFKQFLRDLNINKLYSKIKYLIKKKPQIENRKGFVIETLDIKDFNGSKYNEVSKSSSSYDRVKPIIYDIIYSKPQPISDIVVFECSRADVFIFKGKDGLSKITFIENK